jgi:hypothetical protein
MDSLVDLICSYLHKQCIPSVPLICENSHIVKERNIDSLPLPLELRDRIKTTSPQHNRVWLSTIFARKYSLSNDHHMDTHCVGRIIKCDRIPIVWIGKHDRSVIVPLCYGVKYNLDIWYQWDPERDIYNLSLTPHEGYKHAHLDQDRCILDVGYKVINEN